MAIGCVLFLKDILKTINFSLVFLITIISLIISNYEI